MIERLSADDRLLLGADASWPQDVGAIVILAGARLLGSDGTVRLDLVRRCVASKLHLVPRFRQRIVRPGRGLGGPIWVDSHAFDLDDHILVHPLPPGSDDGALLRAAETIRRTRLETGRPLWELWLLPGLRGERIGVFLRLHHVVGDGRAALTMLGAVLDADPTAVATNPGVWVAAPSPSSRALRSDNLRRAVAAAVAGFRVLLRPWVPLRGVRDLFPGMRELVAEAPGDDTSLNRLIGRDRSFAIVRDRVRTIRAIGRAHGASVNDVLLAATAGGLRALLMSRGERVAGLTLRVLVPISLRGRLHGTVQGNRIAQMVVPLPLGRSDSVARLRAIAAETSVRKGRSRYTPAFLFRVGILRRLLLKAIIGQRINVTTATLTGPRKPLFLAGARVLDLFPMLNLIGNQTIGVGVISYAGSFDICVTADRDAVPDIDVLAAGISRELAALAGPLEHEPVMRELAAAS